jgi:hypothetical protein
VLVDMEGIRTGTAVCLCLSGVFMHILHVRGARARCRISVAIVLMFFVCAAWCLCVYNSGCSTNILQTTIVFLSVLVIVPVI